MPLIVETKSSDEAILAHLEDDESDWLPIDKTGPPPIALSEALRGSLEWRRVALGSDGTLAGSTLPVWPVVKVPERAARAPVAPALNDEGPEEGDAQDLDADVDAESVCESKAGSPLANVRKTKAEPATRPSSTHGPSAK